MGSANTGTPTLFLAGDVMLGRGVDEVLANAVDSSYVMGGAFIELCALADKHALDLGASYNAMASQEGALFLRAHARAAASDGSRGARHAYP